MRLRRSGGYAGGLSGSVTVSDGSRDGLGAGVDGVTGVRFVDGFRGPTSSTSRFGRGVTLLYVLGLSDFITSVTSIIHVSTAVTPGLFRDYRCVSCASFSTF